MIFVNPDCYQGYRFPSIGLLYMAAALERAGLNAEYIDPNYDTAWKRKLADAAPRHDWIGITANILSLKPALELSALIRREYPDMKIIMGGPYPSVRYTELIPEHADAVAVGESEETILDVAGGKPLRGIEGIAWNDGGRPVFNGRRPLVADFDALPFPAWHLGHVPKYRLEHTKHNPVLPLLTSRGCPFKCIFCASRVIFESRIRYRSIDCVVEEFDEITQKHGAREVHIWDDNFTLRRERVIEFCERLIERRSRRVSLMIPSGIKPDIGDYEMFRTMRRAGFYAVCIAVESGDAGIMEKLGKKVDVAKVRDTVAAARRAGLLTNGFFMLGLPYDTEETMRRNIEHACSLPLHQALFFVTIPFPGTELYDIVKEEGRLLYDNEVELYERGYFLGRATCEMPGFDAETLEKMYRLANRRFFFRPAALAALFFKKLYSPAQIFFMLRKWFRVALRGKQF